MGNSSQIENDERIVVASEASNPVHLAIRLLLGHPITREQNLRRSQPRMQRIRASHQAGRVSAAEEVQVEASEEVQVEEETAGEAQNQVVTRKKDNEGSTMMTRSKNQGLIPPRNQKRMAQCHVVGKKEVAATT